MSEKLRLALLISGGGTTMHEILRACTYGRLGGIDPVCIIASTAAAGGIEKAKAAGFNPAHIVVCPPKRFETPEQFGSALIAICEQRGVQLVGQYGWLPRTPENFIRAYDGMMINQHPGPLDPGRPDFGGKGMYGRRVHSARLAYVRTIGRDFWTEATAQRVHPEFDRGVVIKREQVPIEPTDTVESLQARVLPVEHRVQIQALQDFALGRVTELSRSEPLVQPEDEETLRLAKDVARVLYPQG